MSRTSGYRTFGKTVRSNYSHLRYARKDAPPMQYSAFKSLVSGIEEKEQAALLKRG